MDKEQEAYVVSKYLPTDYFIAKGKKYNNKMEKIDKTLAR